ncbi:hypothetical protein NVP1023O_34 [Vibrio phage 1.023.O._10N.222.51.B4]|nr:hypothetical protein NVP1023O_34 [Vibrio phage 1.023.O._10N.222.51.B4]AUR98365.1 hypothetical protein NVP1250O_27 [Vibrio phage 1.250.O._10N.261.55.E11]
MSNVLDVVEGVQEALAETGEDGQIVKTERVRNPTNPTQMITVTKTYNARMYFDTPRASYVSQGVTVQRSAQLYVDWLSLVDTDTMMHVNEIVAGEPVFNVVTSQDDVAVRANGTRLTLLVNIGTNINGVTVMGQHEVAA